MDHGYHLPALRLAISQTNSMTPSKDIHEAIAQLLSQFGDASYEPGDSIESLKIVSAIDDVTERNQELHKQMHELVNQRSELITAVAFVIQGLRKGSIKSKPILHMEPKAESHEMISLEASLWMALNAAGVEEKKEDE